MRHRGSTVAVSPLTDFSVDVELTHCEQPDTLLLALDGGFAMLNTEQITLIICFLSVIATGFGSVLIVTIWYRHTDLATRRKVQERCDELDLAWRRLDLVWRSGSGRRAFCSALGELWSKYVAWKRVTVVGRIDLLTVRTVCAIAVIAVGYDFWRFAWRVTQELLKVV